ncbi:VPLPA-CTERM sorting domain-containing protein [Roseovarius sp. ZX-A-9]|uniref:VPLPA-CTERM sorting domain-containing protein n=1 Tax=Roseovarius sp. ZX-A-9 TaxID=3014783 RepID=UPI00232E8979|nr:VPLPA-CTERM sorting domain-containing protein [Roseovarius sp. ZX-A-9]
MKPITISSVLATLLLATAVQATPISAFSELEVSHSFVINNGSSPEGIDISFGPNALIIDNDATTFVDHPSGNAVDDSEVVIGNQFSDPPLAAERSWLSTTILPNGTEGALAHYHTTILTEDDPDDDNSDITRRSVHQVGEANAVITSDPIAASAASFERSARSYLFTNTTNDLISFNIAGQFDASLGAQYTGIDGFARASAGIELLFSPSNGAEVSYFPISPYLTTIEDTAPGAVAAEQLLIDTGGLTFSASTSAIGDGGTTTALLDAEIRYIFGLSLAPGATVVMDAGFSQANAVDYTPRAPMTPVPVPATLPLLLSGLVGFAALRRRSGAG